MTHRARILHVEDSAKDAELICAALEADGLACEIEVVSCQRDFEAALDRAAIDLILSDYALPTFDGFTAMAIAREKAPEIPFIIVSGALGEEAAIESLRGGATDYVLKHRLSRLSPAVRRALAETKALRERRDAAEALANRQRFLKALLECLGVGVLACDADGALSLFNTAFREMHGLPEELIPSEQWADHFRLFDADGKTPLRKEAFPLRRALRGELIRNREVVMMSKSGPPRTILVNGQAIVGTHGERLGAVIATHDITDRKNLEEQFRQAQRMEAVGRLAGGVAHDFNNLLTAIMGYGQLMTGRLKPDDPVLRDTEEILKAAVRASMLTRQLLAFSRCEVLQPKVLDLNAIVADMGQMLRRLIGEAVDLRVIPAAELGTVKADPGHIEQVIMNLAVNARDAMPEGGTLTIETSNFELGETYADEHLPVSRGSYVLLAVSDTGIGMDEATCARIFEPFFTTKGPGEGTGLGLSTVYGIVQQWGGSIQVYSEPGRGTTFKVYLPRAAELVPALQAVRALQEIPKGSETVLLVEDQDAVAAVIRGMLQLCGYRLLEAHNGADALQVCERHDGPIHILVTDVVMPGIAGPELAERVRTLRPETAVLFISGYTERAFASRCALEPRTAFLQKPFMPDALARKVREVLDETHPSTVTEAP